MAIVVVGMVAHVEVGIVAPGVSYIGAITWLLVQHCLHDVRESLRAPRCDGGAAYWRTYRVFLRGTGSRSILLSCRSKCDTDCVSAQRVQICDQIWPRAHSRLSMCRHTKNRGYHALCDTDCVSAQRVQICDQIWPRAHSRSSMCRHTKNRGYHAFHYRCAR
jgi:hypothetical protein